MVKELAIRTYELTKQFDRLSQYLLFQWFPAIVLSCEPSYLSQTLLEIDFSASSQAK